METGDSVAMTFLHGQLDGTFEGGLALVVGEHPFGATLCRLDQPGCPLTKETSRLAVRVAANFATGRIFRGIVDSRDSHGGEVCETSVTAGVRQQDRMIGDGAAECFMDRIAVKLGNGRRFPFRLVPTAANNPTSRRQ